MEFCLFLILMAAGAISIFVDVSLCCGDSMNTEERKRQRMEKRE